MRVSPVVPHSVSSEAPCRSLCQRLHLPNGTMHKKQQCPFTSAKRRVTRMRERLCACATSASAWSAMLLHINHSTAQTAHSRLIHRCSSARVCCCSAQRKKLAHAHTPANHLHFRSLKTGNPRIRASSRVECYRRSADAFQTGSIAINVCGRARNKGNTPSRIQVTTQTLGKRLCHQDMALTVQVIGNVFRSPKGDDLSYPATNRVSWSIDTKLPSAFRVS